MSPTTNSNPSTNVPIIYGGGSFGDANANGARVNTLTEAQAIVDVFIAHGHKYFDTSNLYGYGSSERFLGQLDLKDGIVDTKVYPSAPGDHAPERLRAIFQQSIKTLGSHNKINILYLHAPDLSTPFEDTLGEINELFKQGHFAEFGLSNFTSAQVTEFHTIAEKNGWIAPTVYQGLYNVLQREMEDDLIHVLRKYNMRFYGYSPLAGGLLARTINGNSEDLNKSDGSRWDPKAVRPEILQWLHATYGPMLPVIQELSTAVAKNNLRLPEVALRWLQHHSVLTSSDGVIIAGKNASQVEANLIDSESGPLPEEILKLLEEAWAKNKGNATIFSLS